MHYKTNWTEYEVNLVLVERNRNENIYTDTGLSKFHTRNQETGGL